MNVDANSRSPWVLYAPYVVLGLTMLITQYFATNDMVADLETSSAIAEEQRKEILSGVGENRKLIEGLRTSDIEQSERLALVEYRLDAIEDKKRD